VVHPALHKETYFSYIEDYTAPAFYHPGMQIKFNEWLYHPIMCWPFIKGTYYWEYEKDKNKAIWMNLIEDHDADGKGASLLFQLFRNS